MGKKEIRNEIEQTHKLSKLIKKENDIYKSLSINEKGFIHIDSHEDITRITQDVIKENVNQQTWEKAYNISLPNGSYKSKYDNTGRYTLVTEKGGQIAMFDVKTKHLFFDIDVEERINDATFLHNELFVAVSQRKNLYIYDNSGREVHCVRKHKNIKKMDFLQYHFLLASISTDNVLRYLDTSSGKLIAEIQTNEMNTCLTKNQKDGIIYMGSEKGIVTLWTPNEEKYVAKILCHETMVNDVQVDRFGQIMVTSGSDNQIKIWDIRNLYDPVNTINTKNIVRNLNLSQNNMLATSFKDEVTIYGNLTIRENGENQNVALKERFFGRVITGLDFCPFEDILATSHNKGVTNIIVPGSGDPNFDSYEESPFRSKKDRQEIEVRRLLEKVPYKLIHLSQSVGQKKDQ